MIPSSNRPGRSAAPAPTAPTVHGPHAALLIDFDNVTMGIRSDLTKELKTLLNSDIIKGKVTVQRAYADWRRYYQYVVPLTERSIEMIWATAVGATKKNATDIRLAIDAMELIFTRPEIGTFIVLSGDSDFSSLVVKLKEYGKYVIGIGIRESASDLLIQNCDEYYSYSELAGLSKEVDTPSAQRDPWELVRDAVQQMARNGDVMRSDRLKQVMQQIDPNFDERNAGYNRFSKFVSEAGTRGLLRLTKLENGQYEVGPGEGGASAPAAEATRGEASEERNGGRRGRGRGRGRGRDRDRDRNRAEEAPAPRAEAAPAPVLPSPDRLTLAAAFALLSRALGELGSPVGHEQLRARMAALLGREDPLLDPTRFGRLLRQANDAEVADVRWIGEDAYEIAARSGSKAAPRPAPAPAQPAVGAASSGGVVSAAPPVESDNGAAAGDVNRAATLRFRRGSRGPLRLPDVPLVGVVQMEPEAEPAAAPAPSGEQPAAAAKGSRSRRGGGRGRKTAKGGDKGGEKPASAAVAASAGAAEPTPEPSRTTAAAKPRSRGKRKAS